MSEDAVLIEQLAWTLCPHLRWMMKGGYDKPECEHCPESSFYQEVDSRGTQFCRHMADQAARAAYAVMFDHLKKSP